MAQKKEGNDKTGVKIKDLAPSKDAKGGAARGTDGGAGANALRGADSARGSDSTRGTNSVKGLD